MRIIAGRWRGRPLVAPPGNATRPTSDRAREALFSILASRLGSFEGLRVADVFAGTGALGLEALSRGAAHASFVDNDRAALAALRANLARLGAEGLASIHQTNAETIAQAPASHDLLFLDPPYGRALALPVLARLAAQGWIAPQALVSVETSREEGLDLPDFALETVRDYGKARLHLLRYIQTPSPACGRGLG